jgi:hypothetical protein
MNFVIEKPLAEQPELLGRRLTMRSFRFRPNCGRLGGAKSASKPDVRLKDAFRRSLERMPPVPGASALSLEN